MKRHARMLVTLGVTMALVAAGAAPVAAAPRPAAASIRTGMTWTVLGQTEGAVHVGSDGVTDPYHGDTSIDQFLSIVCLLVDGRRAPEGITFDLYNGWALGEVKATPPIPGAVLTSREEADAICAEEFGAGWRLAEFHDGRYGDDLTLRGGWSFWAAGALPAGTRFWVAIDDQPANPWNSAGEVPTLAVPKFLPSEAPVPDQYVAMFPEGTPESAVADLANALVAAHGGSIIDVFPSVGGFSFNASDAQARAMSDDSRVETVEQDSYGQHLSHVPWHLDRVDQRALPRDDVYAAPNDGSGVNIYILDSGFRTSHVEFGGRAWQEADFMRLFGQRDDCDGHGTMVGSLAGGGTVGVAPGANLISVRIAGCRGNAYNPVYSVFNSTIVAGLDWVARNHRAPAVANVSYGFPPGFWRRWLGRWFKTKLRTPMDRAVARAVDRGVTVVVSAGQPEGGGSGRDVDGWSSPARAPEAISVSAVDTTDTRPSWANFGKVEIFAPGDDVRVAHLGGDTAYARARGTSMSAPLVAGAAAIYLHDHPWARPAEVRAALLDSATPDVVGNPGRGSANRLLFTGIDTNWARAGAASASSTFSGYAPQRVNDGSRDTALGGDHSWANDYGTYPPNSPEWVQLDLGTARNLRRAVIYTSNGYPIRDFDVQVLAGGAWVTPPGGQVRGNTSLVVNVPFQARTSQFIRVLGISGPLHQPGYVRVNEFEAYSQ